MSAPERSILPASLTRRVPEATYLTVENAHRYRPIMRYFYDQHTAHRYWLRAEEVRDHVRAHLDPAYTDEQCEQDLGQLVQWGNLMAEQEKSRARSVEEFLRRHLRYQLTPYGIAFERLLKELEQEHGTGGSLDPTHLDGLWERLRALDVALAELGDTPAPAPGGHPQERLGPVRRLWVEAYEYFEKTVNGANDYLARMHGARPEDLSEVEAFLAYKDILAEYLRTFVNSLVNHSERIRGLLAGWAERGLPPRLVDLLTEHDTRFLPGPDGRLPEPAVVRAHFARQYRAVDEWFRTRGGAQVLRKVTGDAIQMVVHHSQRLMDRRRLGLSRRRDLEQVARAFAGCRDLRQAHALAAAAFALALPRHVQGSLEGFAMSDRASVWAQEPHTVPLRPVERGRALRTPSAPIPDQTQRQQAILREEIERRQAEALLWDELFAGGEVNLGRLRVADPAVRGRLLEVVGRCLASPDRTAVASDGSRIRLLDPLTEEPGELAAPDGTLVTPQLRLRREREGAP